MRDVILGKQPVLYGSPVKPMIHWHLALWDLTMH